MELNEKFDLSRLKEMDRMLNEVQVWATMQRTDEHDMIDNLCRVAGMYNSVITQLLEDGHIITSDPLDYIENKFSIPYGIYQRVSR